MKKLKLAVLVAMFVVINVSAVAAHPAENKHICTPNCEEHGNVNIPVPTGGYEPSPII